MMDFTPDQQKAIEIHDRNLIVAAGAGSGKTRVLVERYVRLLKANPDWSLNALVAITFTKKAAEEMRDRVRKTLEENLFQASIAEDITRWTNLLGTIDSARIDTIHGLCADLLRQNAAEANLDPDFEVLDETEARILLEDVVDDVIVSLAHDGSPEMMLFTEYEAFAIRKALMSPNLFTANLPDLPPVDDLLALWKAEWLESIADYGRDFLGQIQHIEMFDPVPGDKHGDQWDICQRCMEHISGGDVEIIYNALHEISALDMRVGSAANWGGKEQLAEAKAALTEMREFAKEVLKQIGDEPGELDERAAAFLPLWVSLLRKIKREYQRVKNKQGVLDFDDLEALTCDLLEKSDHVRARYQDTEFKHLLVDEFQDTNAAQWKIVKALADLEKQGSLFVVGDEKQSIYAFRGADVSVFGSVRAEITQTVGEEVFLSTSFRTHKPLIEIFNSIFEKLLVRDEMSRVKRFQVELGKPLEAFRVEPPQDVPPLELLLIDKYHYDEKGEPVKGKDGKPDKLNAESRRPWEAFALADRIHAMVAEGRIIFDKEARIHRPIQYGDFAILFRGLTSVTLYEDVFKRQGLPFVTMAGRGYYDRQEVWDLLNLLQALYNTSDNLSLAAVLRSPMFSLSDDALFAMRLQLGADDKPMPLWDALNKPGDLFPAAELSRMVFARDVLYSLHGLAGRVTISELLQEALRHTGYLAVLTGLPDGARRRGNVEKLLDKAQTSGKVTLGAFSRYLLDMSDSEAREGEAAVEVSGMVQIMTIHASKGLEFPVVILADSASKSKDSDDKVVILDTQPPYELACKVYDANDGKAKPSFAFRRVQHLQKLREDAERLRLLYVAMTRAQDHLIISGQADFDDKSGDCRAGGWLGQMLETLELKSRLAPMMDHVFEQDWGKFRVTIPAQMPDIQSLMRSEVEENSLWEDSSEGEMLMPPLLKAVEIQKMQQARHLSATYIADLGGTERSVTGDLEYQFFRERFRRKVMQDAPTTIEWITEPARKVSLRQIGEVVHQALRYWRLPKGEDDEDLLNILHSYAWQQGITNEAQGIEAVQRAYKLLLRFKQSDMYRWINEAVETHRELPFVYERQGYVIHGIIDVLFRTRDGRWIIADYKTSKVDKYREPGRMQAHARRFHLQLGVYAEAVQAQLGEVVPETYIHYIRYTHTVAVPEYEWRSALKRSLAERIQEVLENET